MTEKTEYVFHGTIQWAYSLFEKGKYGDYRLKFYPKDAATRKAIRDTGTQAKVKEDNDGFFYNFKSEIAVPVTDTSGERIEARIGNGTEVAIKLLVEKFPSQKYGTVARTKLLGVVVTTLVVYEKPEDKVPATTAPVDENTPGILPV